MFRRSVFCVVLMCAAAFACFGQTAALRDYVGMISQGFHPDIVAYMRKLKSDLDKQGYNDVARSIEDFLKGDSGTGFVYVGKDGKNYILTNYHVISHAHTLSVTFEKPDGEKTKFSDLSIVAADEDMDIALLAFAGGQNPFKQGLAFSTRAAQEGDDVFSSGFPALGNTMVYQLGRGIISNASVRLPSDDDADKTIGPYIQHTAQVDPGNSGGPLLVQAAGTPSGYAVVGINTLSYRRRQGTNFSIPVSRIQSFLDASLKPPAADQRPLLETRVNAFVEGLSAPKAVYPHIAKYLSIACTGENAEYAISEVLAKASKNARNDIFDRSVVSSMAYAVAWTIENSIRSKTGSISIAVDSISPGENGVFNVGFKVNNVIVNSEWINEYGIWRIHTFGTTVSGDKTIIEKKKKAQAESERLHSNPGFQLSAGIAPVLERDDGISFGLDIVIRSDFIGYGMRGFFGKGFIQVDAFTGVYIPIKMGTVALTPFASIGLGAQVKDPKYPVYDSLGTREKEGKLKFFGFPIEAGLQFTTAAVPGLYFQAAYQYNAVFGLLADNSKEKDPNILFFSIGYAF